MSDFIEAIELIRAGKILEECGFVDTIITLSAKSGTVTISDMQVFKKGSICVRLKSDENGWFYSVFELKTGKLKDMSDTTSIPFSEIRHPSDFKKKIVTRFI